MAGLLLHYFSSIKFVTADAPDSQEQIPELKATKDSFVVVILAGQGRVNDSAVIGLIYRICGVVST